MPVVAHIRRVGASGAYLVAAEANEIVATKWAAVGSIGVILLRPNVTELLERLGVDVYVRKSGPFKDLGLPFRRPTVEDEEKDAELVGRLFDDFVSSVCEARNLDAEAVEQLATGEVFLGSRAAELNLVDHVGDETLARERLAELMGEASARCLELRAPSGVFGRLRPAAALELLGPIGALTGRPRLESLSTWVD
jgi:protease-4